MCTIMTATPEQWTTELVAQMRADARSNGDGFALVLMRDEQAVAVVRSMNFETILSALDNEEWSRFFLHCRFATQGSRVLANTHGWDSNGVFVMHNGVLYDKNTAYFDVDSQVINYWIRVHGIDGAAEKLQGEPWANVFMIDPGTGVYLVNRSTDGSLYMDGLGNYSTHSVGGISIPVPDNYSEFHLFEDDVRFSWRGGEPA